MARQTTVALVVFLAATALAGCISGDDGPPAVVSDDAAKAVATSDTGSITGEIVTLDLEKLVGVEVALLNRTGGGINTLTDKNARYTFNNVMPGPYRIQVNDECCQAFSTSVDVKANKVAQVNVKVERLSSIEQRLPYIVTDEWDGFLACGIAVGGNTNDTCGENDANHNNNKVITVSEGILEIVAVLDWDPVPTAVDDQLRVHLHRPGHERDDRRCDLFLEGGPPPVIGRATESNASCADVQFSTIEDTLDLQYEIAVQGIGATYQQEFKVYWYEFYNHNAALDFNPVRDG